MTSSRTIEKLLRQQAALANFGSFAFNEPDLQKILMEAARICAESLNVPYSKICRYRPEQNDLFVVAGYGWQPNVVGHVISQADESSTQGRAFTTGKPVILKDIRKKNSYNLPDFYAQHGIVSTVDVLVKGASGPFGVLGVDCNRQQTFDEHDINFLTGFANVVAEAAQTSERTANLKVTLAQMRKLVEEKNVLAEELQHRVRNNLQLVYSMLVRQIERAEHDDKEGIRLIARRVMSLASIYDHLLGHGLVQTIDFGAYLESLCASLHSFQDKGQFEITLDCAVEPMALELDLVTALGIIVTEITSNSYRHAFPTELGTITISLTHKKGDGILIVSDNGVGFAPQAESKRHGVGLIKRLMEQVDGTAELNSENGTVWSLVFPMTEKAGKSLAAEMAV
ncbi:MAG: GAF domain-containing protein [Sneathiella sp.]|nr:GAF domain-containing protein [Sneathiella sp.]